MLSVMTLTSCYDFNREQAEKDAESKGKQTLLEAESSKKATIEESKAKKESAALEAETKLIQAKAAADALKIKSEADAKAIKVISNAIKDNPEYLKYKTIEAMRYGKTIYIPTESSLPITERK